MIKIHADRKVIENLPLDIFSNLGVNQIAYIKTTLENGEISYVVHAADGEEISTFDNPVDAEDFLRFNKLLSITVH